MRPKSESRTHYGRNGGGRALLLSLLVLASLAGCVSLDGSGNITHTILIDNHDTNVHTVDLHVSSQSEEIYTQSLTLETNESDTVLEQNSAGEYTLNVTSESGQTVTHGYSLPIRVEPRESFTRIRIDNSSSIRVRSFGQD